MQTFLPYPEYDKSAQCLDFRRLGKQRVECMQILRTLRGKSEGWKNHPACKMWKGYENSLVDYGVAICSEWCKRGYIDNVCGLEIISCYDLSSDSILPSWLGNKQFHDSHKSNLLRKMPGWYSTFLWDVPNDLKYFWPI